MKVTKLVSLFVRVFYGWRMTDIQELFISLDALIQEVRPDMSAYEAERLQEKLIRGNMEILISTAIQHPELKAYYNGNRQQPQRTDQEAEKSGSA